MPPIHIDRRDFLRATAVGLGGASILGRNVWPDTIGAPPSYNGPNVVIIRFGGGVRRLETIDPEHTYAPYFLRELCPQGTLYTNMELTSLQKVETGHGQGTLQILNGKYNAFTNVSTHLFGERFESHVPTVFEYLRKTYSVPDHETLIVNGEDRKDEEFYSFSNHHLFGATYRCNTLSLFRYKVYLLQRQIAEGRFGGEDLEEKQKELRELASLDQRIGAPEPSQRIESFWDRWREFYGETGFVNPRGDRLLTELALRAMKELRPCLLMVNYNDPDYVHWGNPSHYTRGIAVIDQGIRQIVDFVQADEFYASNTVFFIVPDCGRDSNRLLAVPFQHHFNSKSAHEIFGFVMGPGIARGQVIDRHCDQICVAATIGHVMNMPTEFAEGPALEEVFA